MNLTEKTAYLKGLMEGLELDASKKEVKVLNAMADILNELALTVTDLDTDIDQVYDELDAIDEDLSDIEDAIFEDEDECDDCDCGCGCDDDMYELTCPACGEVISVDEDTLLNEEVTCPACGEKIEIDFDEDDEDVDINGEKTDK